MSYVPLDQVQTTRRLDHAAHLAGLEVESGILKLLLHVALAKVSQVAALACGRAVGLGGGELAEGDVSRLDRGFVALDDGEGFVFCACDFRLCIINRVSPVLSYITFFLFLQFVPPASADCFLVPLSSWTASETRGA